jgi:microcystin-dependent protein
MSTPFIGQVRLVGFNFAPRDHARCDGQLLSISQNSAMFALLGTTYGGDGVSTFALPDLRGRVPLHIGTGYVQGQIGGAETVALTANQMPSHTHALTCNVATGTSPTPAGNFLASAYRSYGPGTTQVSMNASSVSSVGSGTAHNNLMPLLTINYVIALFGVFPSRA